VLAALRAQPGTLRYVAETDLMTFPADLRPAPGSRFRDSVAVGVPGLPNMGLAVNAYNGDSSWLGYNLISGRWYHGPGEVDVSSGFLAATGQKVGDRVTLTVNGKPVRVRIAGEVFIPIPDPTVFVSWQTLAAAGLTVSEYDIALKPGTSTQAYISAVLRTLGPGYDAYTPSGSSVAAQINTSYFRLLAILVAVLRRAGRAQLRAHGHP
jgi:putative ABC transport system permease protein